MVKNASSAPTEGVHLAITVKVREGKEEEFDQALTQFIRESTDFRGVTGVHVQRPAGEQGSREFAIVRSFLSEEHRRHFYDDALYQKYEAATAALREEPPVFRALHGMEAFFRGGPGAPPPRWKMALVTWMGVFPASVLWSRTVGSQLTMLHPVAVTGVVTLLVVATVVWCVMPWLTKAMRPWLRRGC